MHQQNRNVQRNSPGFVENKLGMFNHMTKMGSDGLIRI